MDPEENQRKRFLFLKRVWEVTEASTTSYFFFNKDSFIQENFTEREIGRIIYYLIGKGLLVWGSPQDVSITDYGIDTVENALREPTKPTEFPPINVLHIETFSGGNLQLQQGTNTSTQTGNFSTNSIDEFSKFFSTVSEHLNDIPLNEDQKEDVKSLIETAQVQLKAKKPHMQVLKNIADVTKNVLLGVSGNLVTPYVYNALTTIGISLLR